MCGDLAQAPSPGNSTGRTAACDHRYSWEVQACRKGYHSKSSTFKAKATKALTWQGKGLGTGCSDMRHKQLQPSTGVCQLHTPHAVADVGQRWEQTREPNHGRQEHHKMPGPGGRNPSGQYMPRSHHNLKMRKDINTCGIRSLG